MVKKYLVYIVVLPLLAVCTTSCACSSTVEPERAGRMHKTISEIVSDTHDGDNVIVSEIIKHYGKAIYDSDRSDAVDIGVIDMIPSKSGHSLPSFKYARRVVYWADCRSSTPERAMVVGVCFEFSEVKIFSAEILPP